MIIAGVYQITNQINGKFYIGSSVDVRKRWNNHKHYVSGSKSGLCSYIHRAIRKYGIGNFTFTVLEECAPVKEVLLAREQHYLDTLKPEYNVLPTAGSNLGFKMPPSFFEKRCGLTAWNKGIPMSEGEHKQKFAHAPWTDERRQKTSKALLGKPAWNKGMTMSEAHCQKLAEAHIGQKAWNLGIPHSQETLTTLSQIGKENYKNNPEHQRRATEAARKVNTGRKHSAETNRKKSESNLASPKRKAFAESRRDIPRTEEVKQKVKASLAVSKAAEEYHQNRVGKSRGNNPSGHYGVIEDKSRNKWQARVKGKSYGRFDKLEDAVAKVREVCAELGISLG